MWPAESDGAIDKTILQLRAFLMMTHLVHGRLADIDVGELAAMLVNDRGIGTLCFRAKGTPVCGGEGHAG